MAFGLPKHGPDGRYGALVDIGSGSVGVSLVVSDPLEECPETLWSHREYVVTRDRTNLSATEKDITTTLVNALLELGNTGVRTLREHDPKGNITAIQITIAAPWSFTVSRTVTIKANEAFNMTSKNLEALISKARSEAETATAETHLADHFAVSVITNKTIGVTLNGYPTQQPLVDNVTSASLSQLIALAQKPLLLATHDALDKVLPGAEVEVYTFMHLFFTALRQLTPDTHECCLIDITNEASEMGIVRDNILTFSTHSTMGVATLAREISRITGTTKDEGFNFMRNSASEPETLFSAEKKEQLTTLYAKYESSLIDIFKQTGDTLAIPKTIFLHVDPGMEDFFSRHILSASKQATGLGHTIHLVNSQLLGATDSTDTALNLSAYVFHKQLMDEEYLKER